jgi:hypothetical protein
MSFLLLKRTGLAIGACLVVALFVAACGGGDDDSQPDATAVSSETSDAGNTDATAASTDEPEDTAGNSVGNTDLVDNGDGVACPLVTSAQVSEAIGTEMSDGVGQGGDDGAYDVCDWKAVRGTPFVTLNFYKQDAQEYWDIVLGEPTDVPGIGDKARWVPGRLEVLQGNYYFTVFVSLNLGTPDAELLAAAKAVAVNALESLS